MLTFVQKGLRRLRGSAVDEAKTQKVLDLLLELRCHVPPEHRVINSSVDVATDDANDLMSVRGVMELAVTRISGGNRSLQDGSLHMVISRLGRASTAAREEINNVIIFVIDFIKNLLMSPPSDNEDFLLRKSALETLVTISATALPGELATLSKTVSVVASYLNDDWDTSTALTALIALWYEVFYSWHSTAHCFHSKSLGTRVIPELKKVLPALRSVIQRSRKLWYPLSTCLSLIPAAMDERKVGDAVGLLNQLLETHSNFWSSTDVVPLLSLCGRQNDSSLAAKHLQPFAKRLARQLPAETMLLAVKQLWAELRKGDDDREQRSERLFVVVREWIKSHQRPQVEGAARDLFTMLLEAWDIVVSTGSRRSIVLAVDLTSDVRLWLPRARASVHSSL